MESHHVTQKTRDIAREYRRGDREAARKELGELAFDALGEVFPEAEQSRTARRSGSGFFAGVVVGAALALWLSRRMASGRRR
jgi:hypothetical protein